MNQKIRIGVLVNDFSALQKWQVDCVDTLKKNNDVSIVYAAKVKEQKGISQSSNLIEKLCSSRLFWKLYWKFYKPSQLQEMAYDWASTKKVEVQTQKNTKKTIVADDDKQQLSGVDVILRFGWGILSGEILSLAQYGVWSFHHNDPHVFRGGPPAFWEIYHKKNTQGAILQKLNEKLDGGEILAEATIRTNFHSLSASYNDILSISPELIQKALANIDSDFGRQTIDRKKGVFKTFPSNGAFISALSFIACRKIKFQWRKYFGAENWSVLGANFIKSETISDLNSHLQSQVQPILKTEKSFFADGFLLPDDTGFLAEAYDYQSQKGTIIFHQFSDASKKVVLELDGHCSYPYVFTHDEKVFVAPENQSAGKQQIYEWNAKDQVLENPKSINVEHCIDPTFFKYNGYWWLFCTHPKQSNAGLYVYFSKELFGPYQEHQQNPVKIDVNSARPAGQWIQLGNNWYRPAQKNGAFYGAGIRWMKLNELTPTSFSETWVTDMNPTDYRLLGMHTFSYNSKRIIIDGKTKNAAF